MTTAITPFEPREVLDLRAFPKDKYNVLIPGDMGMQITPFLRPVVRQVEIDPDPEHGEVYPITQRKQGNAWVATELGLSAVGLAKLASVAGILDVPQASGRVDDGRDVGTANYRATIAFRLPDGQWRVVARECTVKLATIAKEVRTLKTRKYEESQDGNYPWTKERLEAEIEKELLLREKFLERLAETGAKNRAVRAALAVRSKYTPAELAKPFALAAVVPDVNAPELRERLIDQATSASMALFGPSSQVGAAPRQLTTSEPEEDAIALAEASAEGGELTAEELGAAERAVDPETGEVAGDEPDWAIDSGEPSPGEQLVVVLRERAEASSAKGGATKPQRERLQAVLRGLGTANVMAVLGPTFGLTSPSQITAAQADAVLDHAEGRTDFQEIWRAAAAELAAPESQS